MYSCLVIYRRCESMERISCRLNCKKTLFVHFCSILQNGHQVIDCLSSYSVSSNYSTLSSSFLISSNILPKKHLSVSAGRGQAACTRRHRCRDFLWPWFWQQCGLVCYNWGRSRVPAKLRQAHNKGQKVSHYIRTFYQSSKAAIYGRQWQSDFGIEN